MPSFSRIVLLFTASGVAFVAIAVPLLQKTTWWAGYDLENCRGCRPVVDWSDELTMDGNKNNPRITVGEAEQRQFERDGVIVLPSAVSTDKVNALARETDALPHTFMTDVISNTLLRHYLEYEHRIDTRSELIRDWAIHGPLGQWAAQLLNADQVRLYNAEKIYHRGNPNNCNPAWHRDTVAAPFSPETRALTINVYFDDISGDNDALIFVPGSHLDLSRPPPIQQGKNNSSSSNANNVFEPHLKRGDILVHDPRIFHSPSGTNCWRRRSLQFRYVASPTTFEFDNNRAPHGPVPWTLAHAMGVAPHGLTTGDPLEGPAYPQVYPSPLASEHIPLPGRSWTVMGMIHAATEAQAILGRLGLGQQQKEAGKKCTVRSEDDKVAYYGFDGPVTSCDGWEVAVGMPLHKEGQLIHTFDPKEEQAK